MWVLLLLLASVGLLIMLFTAISRKNKQPEENTSVSEKIEICCGAHEVCVKKKLFDSDEEPIYFDDEELDILKGIKSEDYSDKELKMISDVFYTLQKNDIRQWVHSLFLRGISLPEKLKKEALEEIKLKN